MRRQPALGTRSAITTDCDPVPPPDLLEKQLGRPETPHRPALSLQEVEMSAQELQPPPRGRPPLKAGGEEEEAGLGALAGGLPAVVQRQAEPRPLLLAGEHQVGPVRPLQPQHAAVLQLNSQSVNTEVRLRTMLWVVKLGENLLRYR